MSDDPHYTEPNPVTILVMYRTRPDSCRTFTGWCTGRRNLGRYLIDLAKECPEFELLALAGIEEE